MPAPDNIHKLVHRFQENLESYRSPRYKEAQVRREFIDPFFRELGWDMDNAQGLAEKYKDVIYEDSLEVEEETKAPDYAFRIGGTRKFFVEAKKPSVNLETDIHPAFQLRRYAWSAKLPLSILTDFEELAVYDCRVKPDKNDKAFIGRVEQIKYLDYVDKWDEIASIFSKDAILRGSFDKYAEGMKGKKGTAEVDEAFLEEIERWRELLAKNIALRNEALSVYELNYAVQMTIDRIVFLRICEDRGIEPYGQLQNAIKQAEVYGELRHLFQQADSRYNSGLFHFKDEKGQSSAADNLTTGLKIDNKPLQDILKNLYYPDSPYVFSEIPSDILGQVYEQFLGKVIRLTTGHQAKVEEKPEVRKAGGVYYTPTYIVNYIVKNTLGKLLEGKTPKEVTRLKILDPACGSGTFLIGAYQSLLDWHLKWYTENDATGWAKGKKPAIFQGKNAWELTVDKKKEILLDNIFAVDIDTQAVEVAKLSLLLKVVETPGQLDFTGERILPDLGKNIKCGNSLIGHEYFESRMLVDEEERQRVNAFDWKAEFPQVFNQGGFDVVMGNPPYVRPHNIPKEIKNILWNIYSTFVAKSDMYSCFMERGLALTKSNGLFSFIVPQTWTSLESFTKIREHFIQNGYLRKLVQLPKKVFADATVETCIFVVERKPLQSAEDNNVIVERIHVGGKLVTIREFSQKEIETGHLHNFQLYGESNAELVLSKVRERGKPLSEFVRLVYGFKTGDDEQFIQSKRRDDESRPFIRSAGIRRYWTQQPSEYVWYVPEKMISNRSTARPGEKARFEAEKIIVARMGKSLAATYDAGGLYVKDAMLLLAKTEVPSLKYVLGILNSSLLTYYYQRFFITIDILKNAILSLPIANIDFSNTLDRARHDKIVSLVERVLALHRQNPRTPQDKEALAREIESTDNQIDKLVYELYGLTEEEIKIVEG